MKPLIAMKLIVFGVLIVLFGEWLRGHDILTAIVLTAVASVVGMKLYFHLRYRREGGGQGGGGNHPGGVPIPIPPVRPKPREFTSAR